VVKKEGGLGGNSWRGVRLQINGVDSTGMAAVQLQRSSGRDSPQLKSSSHEKGETPGHLPGLSPLQLWSARPREEREMHSASFQPPPSCCAAEAGLRIPPQERKA